MEKEVIFEKIELLQEQQRRAVLYDNYKLEIDCMLLVIEFYNMACKADPENRDKYLRTIDEQTKIVKEKMAKHNYYGEKTRIEDINKEIVKISKVQIDLTKKDLK